MGQKQKQIKSYVISMRISDEELKEINEIMQSCQITRISDVLRHAIKMIQKDKLPVFHNQIDNTDQKRLFQSYV